MCVPHPSQSILSFKATIARREWGAQVKLFGLLRYDDNILEHLNFFGIKIGSIIEGRRLGHHSPAL